MNNIKLAEKIIRKQVIKSLNENEHLLENEMSFEYNVWKSPINGEKGTVKLNGKTIAYIKSNGDLEIEDSQDESKLNAWWSENRDEALKGKMTENDSESSKNEFTIDGNSSVGTPELKVTKLRNGAIVTQTMGNKTNKIFISNDQLSSLTLALDISAPSINESEEVLEEGLKETIASAALSILLATAPFTNIMGQKNTDDVLKKVKDKQTQETVAKKVSEIKGIAFEDVLKDIENNAKSFEKEYSKSGKMGSKTVSTEEEVVVALDGGYAISDFQKLLKTKPVDANALSLGSDTAYNFDSDDMFKTAEYVLSPEAKAQIASIVSTINDNNGEVKTITIESSTDTEPISMGNERLSELRANSVKEVLVSMGVPESSITISTKPNSGPNVYNRTMSDTERAEARKQTAEYRYVNLLVNAVNDSCLFETPAPPNEMYDYSYTLVKSQEKNTTIKKPPITKIKTASWTSKSVKCPAKMRGN